MPSSPPLFKAQEQWGGGKAITSCGHHRWQNVARDYLVDKIKVPCQAPQIVPLPAFPWLEVLGDPSARILASASFDQLQLPFGRWGRGGDLVPLKAFFEFPRRV